METKDLAEFYGVTRQSVEKWTPAKRHQKTVQALAGAEQPIVDLLADITKLTYIFDCKHMLGTTQRHWCSVSRIPSKITVSVFGMEGCPEITLTADLDATNTVEQLELIKRKLEVLVYGVQAAH